MVNSIKKAIIMTIFVIFALFLIPIKRGNAGDDVLVVANSSFLKSDTHLSYSDIEDIFTLRKKKWSNGTTIRVFILPRSNPRTKEFTTKYLSMTPNRYFDILENRESLGKGNIAEIIESDTGIVLKVLTTPGSIGYTTSAIIVNFGNNLVIVR